MSSDPSTDAEVGGSGLAQDDSTPSAPPPSTPSAPSDGGLATPTKGGFSKFNADELPPLLLSTLQKKGFESLTSVQEAVVRADTNSRDVRISSQTGSGKTVAVGIAMGRELLRAGARHEQIAAGSGVHPKAPQVLLLTPTRELATQVKRELAWLFAEVPDALVEVVTGGTSVGQERKNLSRGPRIVVGTPGRVLDHLTRGGFVGDFIDQVILDEADQMLDMGFRDELEAILETLPKERRTHLVSATFSGEVKKIAERFQKEPIYLEGSPLGKANEDIEHVAHVVGMRHRYDALINVLLRTRGESAEGEAGRTLIFTRTRADTLEVAERLQRDGFRAEPLSGDLAQAQRTRTLSAFRAGQVDLIVATDVAARGLDVQGIELVVHYDPPGDPDSYTHRSGRTGRAGRKGTSVLLLPPQARGRIERLLHIARIKPQWAPVPTAQKIRKLYSKAGKRRLYTALEVPATEEQLAYAKKVLEEADAEQVVAQLLSMIDLAPPCPPREISEHIASENRGRRPAPERGPHRKTGAGPRGAEGRTGPRGPMKPGRGKFRDAPSHSAARRPARPGEEDGQGGPRFGRPKRRFR